MDTEAPPAGSLWDAPLARCPFAFFDLEMTGPDPERDAIVEIAITRVVGGVVVGALNTLVATEVASQPEALALHGIDIVTLASARSLASVADEVIALFSGAVPVVHGGTLDLPFLHTALASVGHDFALEFVLDTVTLARRALHARSYALGSLAAKLGLGDYRWHRAGEDVRALRALFGVVATALDPATARDLWEVRVGQRHAPAPMLRSAVVQAVHSLGESHRVATIVARSPGREAVALQGIVRAVGRHAVITLPDGGVRSVRLDRILRVEPWP